MGDKNIGCISNIRAVLCSFIFIFFLTSCATNGPSTVEKDRFDYVSAISKSREQQMLLNIIKIRFVEVPLFLNVGQIVAGYNFQAGFGVSTNFVQSDNNSAGLSGNGSYLERPTITYSPVTGKRFEEMLMKPLSPAMVLFLVEAGWSADTVMRLTLDSVNGKRNYSALANKKHTTDDGFENFVSLFERVQSQGALGIRMTKDSNGIYSTVINIRTENLNKQLREDLNNVRLNLGLAPDSQRFKVEYGQKGDNLNSINLLTRSLMQILLELSSGVELRPEDIGKALVMESNDSNKSNIVVKSGTVAPTDAFVKVYYRNSWYWIEDTDIKSKIIFGFLILLSNLAEGGGETLQPVISIQG